MTPLGSAIDVNQVLLPDLEPPTTAPSELFNPVCTSTNNLLLMEPSEQNLLSLTDVNAEILDNQLFEPLVVFDNSDEVTSSAEHTEHPSETTGLLGTDFNNKLSSISSPNGTAKSSNGYSKASSSGLQHFETVLKFRQSFQEFKCFYHQV